MPARDKFHDNVRNALTKDGWIITDDPLHLKWGAKDMFVDLGAESLFSAEKGERKIAVEIKSFVSASDLTDLHNAVGQYTFYHDVMEQIQPGRELYLAVRSITYTTIFQDSFGKLMLDNNRLKLLVFNADTEEIVRWLP